jgi:DNA-binding PadR family transcriptional regulator
MDAMLKKLHIYSAMHQLGRFTSADVAKVAGVGESTVYTAVNRMKDGWVSREPVKTGLRGGQRVLFQLTDEGRQGIAEDLGRASEAVRLAPASTPGEGNGPLGLRSALDTLRDLEATSDPELIEMLRLDAVRDLDWAEAEVRGTGYLRGKDDLIERIAKGRRDLAEFAPTQPTPVEVLEPTVAERVAAVARSVLERLTPVLSGVLVPSPARVPQLVTAMRTGRHIIIGRVSADRGTQELAFAAKYALEGALVQARRFVHDLDVDIHDLQADELAGFLVQARELDSFHSNSLVFLVVNSMTGEGDAQSALERTAFFDSGAHGAVLDRGFSERLATYTKEHQFRYEPEASNPKHMGWVAETMSAYSADQDRSVGSVFGAL